MYFCLRVGYIAAFAAFMFTSADAVVAYGADYYVAPNGSSGGDGSISNPWDLGSALSRTGVIQAGDTLWVRGGTYHGTFTSHLQGTPSSPVVVRQMPGERAIIDGGNSNGSALFTVSGTYTWFWGFEVM